MSCIISLGSVLFLLLLVLNLAYNEYSLYQIWSVYMHYSRCYDHCNKCLLLVIQQTEVLLNFFGECMYVKAASLTIVIIQIGHN